MSPYPNYSDTSGNYSRDPYSTMMESNYCDDFEFSKRLNKMKQKPVIRNGFRAPRTGKYHKGKKKSK